MVYLDTNILVSASINQDEAKRQISLDLIEELVSCVAFQSQTILPI
jgi:hypothetical protein